MSKLWAAGSTGRWKATRLRVLERDDYRCQLRTHRCIGRANVVHHIIGKRYGDTDLSLLQAACAPCNNLVGEPKADNNTTFDRRTTW